MERRLGTGDQETWLLCRVHLSLIINSLRACQTPSPMLSSGKLKIAIEIIIKKIRK